MYRRARQLDLSHHEVLRKRMAPLPLALSAANLRIGCFVGLDNRRYDKEVVNFNDSVS